MVIRRLTSRALAALIAGFSIWPCTNAQAQAEDAPIAPVHEVKDLYYGKVLYQYFQRKFFSSTTQLLIAQQKQRLNYHANEAELLLGGLYLAYGLYDEAEEIFQRMIKLLETRQAKNTAWLYLAESYYQRGRLVEAERALGNIEDASRLPREQNERRILLLSNVYLRQKKYAGAIRTLQTLDSESMWARYGVYNLGVAFIKSGRIDEGREVLDELGQLKGKDREITALRDKANLALGYALLSNKDPRSARDYLARVRLQGPYSNQALYGMAQSNYDNGDYEDALRYWSELAQRSLKGTGVMEAKLSLPQSFYKLNALQQAADGYTEAIDVVSSEIKQLDAVIDEMRKANLFERMLRGNDVIDELDWFWSPDAIPDPLRHHAVTRLFASHEFNQALRTYRDLRFFYANLKKWRDNMDAFEEMLNLRRQRFEQRRDQTTAQQDILPLGEVSQEFQASTAEVERIRRDEDAAALASVKERQQLTRLETVEQRLRALQSELPADRYAEASHKQRLLKGMLTWRLATDFKPRLRNAERQVHEAELLVAESNARYQSLRKAQHEAPREFKDFERRIKTQRERILTLMSEVLIAAEEQENAIRELAIAKLTQQRERWHVYLTRTQFALAQLYDLSAKKKPSAETSPPQ